LLAGRITLATVWRPFEIHPEVPAAGMPLSALGYDPEDLAAAMANLRRQAAAEGIMFAPRSPESLLANTHRALAASAIVQARDPGRFEAFHHAVFQANFGDLRDIGDTSVLREIAAGVGLDAGSLDAALAAGDGETALHEATEEARRRKITAVPAFVFNGRDIVIGAHPPETLRQAAEKARGGGARTDD
jgi:predicted DsbA family dithiol-disulfide isomerase